MRWIDGYMAGACVASAYALALFASGARIGEQAESAPVFTAGLACCQLVLAVVLAVRSNND